jgi:hypothetical protein
VVWRAWWRRVASAGGGASFLQVQTIFALCAVVESRGGRRVDRSSSCFRAVGCEFVIDELLFYHHVFHRGIALLDCAIARIQARIASKPSGSAAGKSKVVPVGAEQVDPRLAFVTTV